MKPTRALLLPLAALGLSVGAWLWVDRASAPAETPVAPVVSSGPVDRSYRSDTTYPSAPAVPAMPDPFPDPPAAAESALAIDDFVARGEQLRAITAAWSARDLPACAEFVATRFPPSPAQAQAASALVETWAERDLGAASRYVAHMPESPGRQGATEALILALAARGDDAATGWLEGLQDRAHRDLASSYLAQAIASREPERARQLASQIADADLRERCLVQLAARAP